MTYRRWWIGAPLALVHLLNAVVVYYALAYGPAGAWDDQGYAGTELECLIALFLSAGAIVITLLPPVRRTVGLWWLVPPAVLGVIAWVRIATLG
ncbi:hypothetical protein OG429_22255 [Streptomyces sp. NBC_00190]|uniref:hypothetical protein n=1 Tax=unclassified Streptomyces TaxID=2593676 RepID=UPI002E2D6BA5|nr:hypothetical protein [Streptomyces sp. NBC_00190]WSZ41763.1 hypothetical protein OG239_25020 [Streptomyces sp. NBC_00868]